MQRNGRPSNCSTKFSNLEEQLKDEVGLEAETTTHGALKSLPERGPPTTGLQEKTCIMGFGTTIKAPATCTLKRQTNMRVSSATHLTSPA